MTRPVLTCVGCGLHPDELDCYTTILQPGEEADDYVWNEEGTLNQDNGHFLCDGCYIAAGAPSAPGGWRCPS